MAVVTFQTRKLITLMSRLKFLNVLACGLLLASVNVSCKDSSPLEHNYPRKDGEKTEEKGDNEKPGETETDTIKVLAIGNSFSANAVEQYLYELLDAEGVKVVIGNMYIGGCPLDKHVKMAQSDSPSYSYRKIVDGKRTVTESVKLSEALKDENWDYISFQQGAGNHGVYSTIEPDLTTLISYCRLNASNKEFKAIYHAPWAAAKDCTSSKFAIYNNDQTGMYNAIVETTREVQSHHDDIAVIMNSFDAIQNARTSYLGDNLNSDGWHLNNTGKFIVACLWCEKLCGKDVSQNTYCPAELTSGVVSACKKAAHAACGSMYKVTDLSSLTDTDPKVNLETLAAWSFSPTEFSAYAESWAQNANIAAGTNAAYATAPGEIGYILANKSGSGRLSYVRTKYAESDISCGHYILKASNGGQPVVRGAWTGDYWLFETTGGTNLKAGDHVRFTCCPAPSTTGVKYWVVEYLDGTEWNLLSDLEHVDVVSSDDATVTGSVDYNAELPASSKLNLVCDVTLKHDTPEWKVKMTCASPYQVNGVMLTAPNAKAVNRIAGTPTDDNMPLFQIYR